MRSVASDPFAPDVVLTGAYLDGIFTSVDRGRSWSDVSHDVGFDEAAAIAFDPTTAGTIDVLSFGNFDGDREGARRGIRA